MHASLYLWCMSSLFVHRLLFSTNSSTSTFRFHSLHKDVHVKRIEISELAVRCERLFVSKCWPCNEPTTRPGDVWSGGWPNLHAEKAGMGVSDPERRMSSDSKWMWRRTPLLLPWFTPLVKQDEAADRADTLTFLECHRLGFIYHPPSLIFRCLEVFLSLTKGLWCLFRPLATAFPVVPVLTLTPVPSPSSTADVCFPLWSPSNGSSKPQQQQQQ